MRTSPRRSLGVGWHAAWIAVLLVAGCSRGDGRSEGGGEEAECDRTGTDSTGADGAAPAALDFEAVMVAAFGIGTGGSAVADLNEDGRADVVLFAPNASVYLADPHGRLGFAGALDVTATRGDILVGDFTEDGHVDAIVDDDDGPSSLFAGDGTGRLTSVGPLGLLDSSAVIGDFDLDCHLDVASARPFSHPQVADLIVRLGDGGGRFSDPIEHRIGGFNGIGPIESLDLDGDGRSDLLATETFEPQFYSGTIHALLSDGQGGFVESARLGGQTSAFASGDFDGDGALDVAACRYFVNHSQPEGYRAIFLNDGTATTFTLRHFVEVPTRYRPIVGDFDGDGLLDLFVAPGVVLRGDGRGALEEPGEVVAGFAYGGGGSHAADFDGDGTADLAIAERGMIRIARRSAASAFRTAIRVPVGPAPRRAAAGDLDEDGVFDLVVILNEGRAEWLRGDGSGRFATAGSFDDLFGDATDAATADVNGDGHLDVGIAHGATQRLAMFLGDGSGGFTTRPEAIAGGEAGALVLDDVDSDGRIDAVLALFDDGAVSVLLGAGDGTFGSPLVYPVGVRPQSVAVADFDGDGRRDELAIGVECGITVLTCEESGTPDGIVHVDLEGAVSSVAACDFNEDGFADVFATVDVEGLADRVALLLGNGACGFAEGSEPMPAIGSNPGTLVANDLNGDGRADFALVAPGSRVLTAAIGSGNGAVEFVARFAVDGLAADLIAMDANGDGLADLVVIDESGATLCVLLNASPRRP